MNIKTLVVISVLTAIFTTILLVPLASKGEAVPHETIVEPHLSPSQIIWLARLMQCESGIKAGAINPKDLDNTPSLGILQFKVGTYAKYATDFGLASTTDYMNPEGQVTIVEHWILDGGIDWSHQFPACVKKLGVPPSQVGSLPVSPSH